MIEQIEIFFLVWTVIVLYESVNGNSKRADACETTEHAYFKPIVFNSGAGVIKSWLYENFASVDDLRFECDAQVFCKDLQFDGQFYVMFDFKTKKRYDEALDIRPFVEFGILMYCFYNVDGFDVGLNNTLVITNENKINLFFYYTRFDFYLNGRIIDAELCDASLWQSFEPKFFSLSRTVSLVLTDGVSFEKPICPFVFKNADLSGLRLDYLRDNFLARILPKYIVIKNEQNLTIEMNFKINLIELQNVYRLKLDLELFDKYTFQKARSLNFNGYLTEIQTQFFKSFRQLEILDVTFSDLRGMFHSSLNEWLAYVNYHKPSYESKAQMRSASESGFIDFLAVKISDFLSHYEYPDEDFCLFKHFPAKKAILMYLLSYDNRGHLRGEENNSSCTYKYLTQNNAALQTLVYDYDRNSLVTFDDTSLESCDFRDKLISCTNLTLFDIEKRETPNLFVKYEDILYAFEWLEFVGPVVSFSIFAATAFVLNLIVILVITNKENHKEKLFESKLFKYIRLNSIFNCVECLIYQFKLMSICIGAGYIYCSSVRSSLVAQYFSIAVVGYLSETIKTCSIITGTLFSLQRYIETTKPENKFLEDFAKTRMRYVATFTILVSSLVSVSKIFEYEVVDEKFMSHDSPFAFSVYIYNDQKGVQVKTVFYFLHYIFNDFAVLVINLFIDIKLVFEIKKNLTKKLLFYESTSAKSTNSLLRKLEKTRLKEELIKKRKAENKANEMIILIVFIYLFCRLPEFIGVFYFYFKPFLSRFPSPCKNSTICYFVSNMVEYFYMLSYIFNIILYYKFNSSFRKGFRIFFHLKHSKI